MISVEAAAASVDIPRTYGSLLLGASLAFGLSGIVAIQCVVYFKLYPNDAYTTKAMVLGSWMLDAAHSSFVIASIYDFFITYYGVASRIDHIPWSIAFSIVVTAVQTLLVHCFFAAKILKSSRNNWYITAPILVLAFLRLLAACVSTTEMIRLHRFSAFTEKYPGWVFTTGLTLSAGVDIIITGWLCYFLREIRLRISPDSTIMIRMVDTLTLYTLENGALTCFTATASLICWLIMPHNLVFLGLHFVISKLYANSLLASLNTRQELRKIHTRMRLQQLEPWQDQETLNPHSSKDRQAESVLRIQNSKSDRSQSDDHALEDMEALHVHRRLPHEPTVIQFRPASSYYWNIIANPA